MRSCGASTVVHSLCGRGRRTRLFVPGTLTFLLLFQTIVPAYSSRRIISRIADAAHCRNASWFLVVVTGPLLR